jgi:hypothetical protein
MPHMIDSTEKGQTREDDRYMWGFGLRPNPHMYPAPRGHFFQCARDYYLKELL